MNGRVAVVTGGAVGLGREIVSALLQSGCRVAVNYHRSREAANVFVTELGDNAIAVQADVGNFGEVECMSRRIFDLWGRMDIIVNNAGITKDALLVKQSEEDWERVMAVNVKGAFNVMKACVPLMKQDGHVINISSYSGLKGNKGQAAYSASKAALLGLTKTAALELALNNVRVNAVLPGYMSTGMGTAAFGSLEQAKAVSLLLSLSDPRDVAQFIAYLVTTKNITGQTFVFDSRIV
jgi:3-oxoacyl-[acyl-carrier protein] reductase